MQTFTIAAKITGNTEPVTVGVKNFPEAPGFITGTKHTVPPDTGAGETVSYTIEQTADHPKRSFFAGDSDQA